MPQVTVSCSQCGSGEYRLVSAKTGEVVCVYCRNQWIVPELIQKTETEKFLEEQAKQPRVIHDNTTETDKQLMDMMSGMVGAGAGAARSANKVIRTVIIIAAVILVLLVGCLLVNFLGGLRALFG